MSAPCPVFGFAIVIEPNASLSDQETDAVVDDLIGFLEQNGLVTGSGGRRAFEFFVSREGSQATHADRELLFEWAGRWKSHATIAVSDLVDLNQTA